MCRQLSPATHSNMYLLETAFQVMPRAYTPINILGRSKSIFVDPSPMWALSISCEVAQKLVPALLVFSIQTSHLLESSAGFKHAKYIGELDKPI